MTPTSINSKEYFSNYMFHPFSSDLNAGESCWVAITSCALAVLTLGIAHLTCYYLYKQRFTLLERNYSAPIKHVAFLAARTLTTPYCLTVQNKFEQTCQAYFEEACYTSDHPLLDTLSTQIRLVSTTFPAPLQESPFSYTITSLKQRVDAFLGTALTGREDIVTELYTQTGKTLDIAGKILEPLPRRDFDALMIASKDHWNLCQEFDTPERLLEDLIILDRLPLLDRLLGRRGTITYFINNPHQVVRLFGECLYYSDCSSIYTRLMSLNNGKRSVLNSLWLFTGELGIQAEMANIAARRGRPEPSTSSSPSFYDELEAGKRYSRSLCCNDPDDPFDKDVHLDEFTDEYDRLCGLDDDDDDDTLQTIATEEKEQKTLA